MRDSDKQNIFGETLPSEVHHDPHGIADDPLSHAPHEKLCRMVRDAFDAAEEEREVARKCLRYYHGHQLSDEVRAELRRRGQPPVYYNRIGPAVDGTLGLLDANQTDPEAIGRNEDDEDAALLVTEILRYLVDKNDFDETKRQVTFEAFTQGIGAAITEILNKDGDAKVSPICRTASQVRLTPSNRLPNRSLSVLIREWNEQPSQRSSFKHQHGRA